MDALIVDDDDAVRDVIASYFTKLGLAVTSLTDGRAAIALLERSQGRYGMIVTDLSLPGADGLAVLKAARQVNASSYVVIVTGYASLDTAIAAVRLGAYDYLTKPFSLGQLEVIVRRIVDRESLERENRGLLHGAAGRPTAADMGERLVRIETALHRIEATLALR